MLFHGSWDLQSYPSPLPLPFPPSGPSGNTALHLAAQKGMVATVKLLIAYGADAAARNAYGETPIHCAAQRGQAEMVGLMVQQVGGSVGGLETYRMKRGPLHLAAGGGHIEVIKRLIEARVDPGARDALGCPPVFAARAFPQAAKLVAQADPFMVALLKDKKKKGKSKGGKKRK